MTAKVAKSSNRGSKPGERRGGRRQGTLNKATADIKAAAQEYSAQALQVLVQVATEGESDAARVAAANAILDRAHGKPKQSVDLDATVAATVQAIGWDVVDPPTPRP